MVVRPGSIFRRYNIDYNVTDYDWITSLLYCECIFGSQIFNMLPTVRRVYEDIRINDIEVLFSPEYNVSDIYDSDTETTEMTQSIVTPIVPPALVRSNAVSAPTLTTELQQINPNMFEHLQSNRQDLVLTILDNLHLNLPDINIANVINARSYIIQNDIVENSDSEDDSEDDSMPELELVDPNSYFSFVVGVCFKKYSHETEIYTIISTDGSPVHTIECVDSTGATFFFKILPHGKDHAIDLLTMHLVVV